MRTYPVAQMPNQIRKFVLGRGRLDAVVAVIATLEGDVPVTQVEFEDEAWEFYWEGPQGYRSWQFKGTVEIVPD